MIWTTFVNGYQRGEPKKIYDFGGDIYRGNSNDLFVSHKFVFYDAKDTAFTNPLNTALVAYSPGNGVSIDSGSQYNNPYFPILLGYGDQKVYGGSGLELFHRPGTKQIQVYPDIVPTWMFITFTGARPRDVPPYNGVPQ